MQRPEQIPVVHGVRGHKQMPAVDGSSEPKLLGVWMVLDEQTRRGAAGGVARATGKTRRSGRRDVEAMAMEGYRARRRAQPGGGEWSSQCDGEEGVNAAIVTGMSGPVVVAAARWADAFFLGKIGFSVWCC